MGESVPKKVVSALITSYDSSGEGVLSFPDFCAVMYGIRTGSLNASNPYLRSFLLQRSSREATIDMLRTSSTNLVELSIQRDTAFGQDVRIYDALRVNSSLTSLSINKCSLAPSHATTLAEALLDNMSLSSLNLDSNTIEDAGFFMIAEALRMPPDVRDAWEQVRPILPP